MGHEIFRLVGLLCAFLIGSQKGMHPTWGEGGGVGRGRDGRGVAEGYAPCLGVGYCRKVVFEGLSRGVRGDALACRGHPYMFFGVTLWVNGEIEGDGKIYFRIISSSQNF